MKSELTRIEPKAKVAPKLWLGSAGLVVMEVGTLAIVIHDPDPHWRNMPRQYQGVFDKTYYKPLEGTVTLSND